MALGRRIDDHPRQPRRQRQSGDGAALLGEAAALVERAERGKEAARLSESGRGRRIQKGERRRIDDAPDGEIEQKAGEIGGEDFRPGEGDERPIARLFPQPIADAGLGTSGAAATLVGSKRGTRERPPSITTRTPSMVSEVSAIEVASTILRRSGGEGARAWSCAARSIAP
jgi:hypothetical protein